MNPFQAENDTLLLSTDANPSPGFSRVRSFFSVTVSLFICGLIRLLQEQKMIFLLLLVYLEPPSAQVHFSKGLLFSML